MIAAHVPNIMDRSRFGRHEVRFVDHASEAADAEVILVDLDRCAEAAAFAALTGHTIGFASHVDSARLMAAADSGFDEVMARSAFFRKLPTLLSEGGAASPESG